MVGKKHITMMEDCLIKEKIHTGSLKRVKLNHFIASLEGLVDEECKIPQPTVVVISAAADIISPISLHRYSPLGVQ